MSHTLSEASEAAALKCARAWLAVIERLSTWSARAPHLVSHAREYVQLLKSG
eukprot:CAMPEP_0119414014 /NCGR_PEP_ID=MMETSP1335-20130426/6371_1 /TAXON_ID=259385 /ORGANISM="Chrysoculter rhomboideus, Strain RCC1486" /LENGTH=51 /DNA_ID=CAMNT_0007438861 /DNA_START=58 /DNA_END=209 /DNA_ORIENTATION=+